MYKSLVKKFLSFSIGNWISMIIAFFTTPITTRLYKPEHFGKYSMYLLLVNILHVVALLGTDQSYIRFYNNVKEKLSLLLKCFSVAFVTFSFISMILLMFSREISIFMFSEENIKIIYIIIFGLLLNIINRFLLTNIRMQQNGKLYSFVGVFSRITEVLFIVGLYKIVGKQYESLIYASLCSSIIIVFFLVIVQKKIFNKMYTKIDLQYREILGYGIPFTFSLIIFWLFDSVDKIALKQFSSYDELGLYAASMKIVGILVTIQNSFTTFWAPVALEKYEKNPTDKKFFKEIQLMVGLAMLILGIILIMFSDVTEFLLGEKYSLVADIVPFLFFIPIMYTVSETTVIGINFCKKTKWHIIIALISCICNIIGNYILVPYYGAKGAAISTGISYIVFFIMRTHISLKFYKVDFKLKKFYIGTSIMFIYAFFASLNDFSIFHLVVGILCIFLVFIVYGDEMKHKYGYLKRIRNSYKIN
jgi:O-antigen/teichoic acid export membrane protein